MSEKQPDAAQLDSTLVEALRKELGWSKAELARRAGVAERTITNMDDRELVTEDTCMRVVAALNRGMQEKPPEQLEFPFVKLEEVDLFQSIPDDKQRRLKALPGPGELGLRRRNIKIFMIDKAKQKTG